MLTNTCSKQTLTGEETFPYQWQFYLQGGRLICDERLLNFLGYSSNSKLNLDSLFKLFNAAQIVELKKLVKQTLVSRQSTTSTFVTMALETRKNTENTGQPVRRDKSVED